MDEDELRAKVKAALERRLPQYGRIKEFYLEIAELADAHIDSVANWTKGKNAPQAHNLLNLFEKLDGFEQEVRGSRAPEADLSPAQRKELAERLRMAAAGLEHSLKNVTTLEKKGTVS